MWSPQGLELRIVWRLWNANAVGWWSASCAPGAGITHPAGWPPLQAPLMLHTPKAKGSSLAFSFCIMVLWKLPSHSGRKILPLPGDRWARLYICMYNSALVVGAKPSTEKLYSIWLKKHTALAEKLECKHITGGHVKWCICCGKFWWFFKQLRKNYHRSHRFHSKVYTQNWK